MQPGCSLIRRSSSVHWSLSQLEALLTFHLSLLSARTRPRLKTTALTSFSLPRSGPWAVWGCHGVITARITVVFPQGSAKVWTAAGLSGLHLLMIQVRLFLKYLNQIWISLFMYVRFAPCWDQTYICLHIRQISFPIFDFCQIFGQEKCRKCFLLQSESNWQKGNLKGEYTRFRNAYLLPFTHFFLCERQKKSERMQWKCCV